MGDEELKALALAVLDEWMCLDKTNEGAAVSRDDAHRCMVIVAHIYLFSEEGTDERLIRLASELAVQLTKEEV